MSLCIVLVIDNIFGRLTHNKKKCKSGIIYTELSDHFPCFLCLDQKLSKNSPPKFIEITNNDTSAISTFCSDFNNINIMQKLDQNTSMDPTDNYNIIEDLITSNMNKHFPTKKVKFDKHKHKYSP